LFLPFPVGLAATSTFLSPLAALLAATIFLKAPDTIPASPRIRRIKAVWDQLLAILPTVLATLALAYLYPESILGCRLDQQWQSFFQAKDSRAIRSIQDSLRCCGLRSIHDRAWPFKDKDHGDDACQLQLGYDRSCFAPWRQQQQGVAWMVVTAAVLIWATKVVLPFRPVSLRHQLQALCLHLFFPAD
jgi:hypothetical protein